MAVRVCRVSFTSPMGLTHSADVEAETLYEAAALGLARLKSDGWIEGLGPASRLEIQIREPGTNHVVSVQQVQRWLLSAGTPADMLRKSKLKQLLKSDV